MSHAQVQEPWATRRTPNLQTSGLCCHSGHGAIHRWKDRLESVMQLASHSHSARNPVEQSGLG